jgi:hypothetical protein
MPLSLQKKRYFYFLLACAGGFLLWYASPQLFGHREPWDGDILHYGGALIALGLGLRLLFIALPTSVYYGVVIGQFFGLLWPHFAFGNLFPLGAILILLCSLLAYFGAWLGQHIR